MRHFQTSYPVPPVTEPLSILKARSLFGMLSPSCVIQILSIITLLCSCSKNQPGNARVTLSAKAKACQLRPLPTVLDPHRLASRQATEELQQQGAHLGLPVHDVVRQPAGDVVSAVRQQSHALRQGAELLMAGRGALFWHGVSHEVGLHHRVLWAPWLPSAQQKLVCLHKRHHRWVSLPHESSLLCNKTPGQSIRICSAAFCQG